MSAAKLLVSNALIKLIQDDETTWQTKNIAAVTTTAEEIPFTVSSPIKPLIPKEKGEWGKTFLIYLIVATFGMVAFEKPLTGMVLGFVAIVFHRIYKKFHRSGELAKWKVSAQKTSLLYEEWDRIRKMPGLIHSLIITTTAGTHTMMQSLDVRDIKAASDLIQSAMAGNLDEAKEIEFSYKVRNNKNMLELKNIEFGKAEKKLL